MFAIILNYFTTMNLRKYRKSEQCSFILHNLNRRNYNHKKAILIRLYKKTRQYVVSKLGIVRNDALLARSNHTGEEPYNNFEADCINERARSEERELSNPTFRLHWIYEIQANEISADDNSYFPSAPLHSQRNRKRFNSTLNLIYDTQKQYQSKQASFFLF